MNINYKQVRIDNGTKVLVHFCGMSACKEENQALMDVCKAKGISFIGIDLPGQGEAEIIKNIDKPEMLYMAKLATIHFNQINSDDIIVSGHSMGAAIALLVSSLAYDKVSRIILESPVNPSILSTDGAREKLESIIANITTHAKLVDGKVKMVDMDDKTKQFYQALGKDLSSEKFIKELKKNMSKVADKRIDVIFGEDDPIIPSSEGMKLIRRIGKPNIVGHIIPKAKHTVHNDSKEAYCELLDRILKE